MSTSQERYIILRFLHNSMHRVRTPPGNENIYKSSDGCTPALSVRTHMATYTSKNVNVYKCHVFFFNELNALRYVYARPLLV